MYGIPSYLIDDQEARLDREPISAIVSGRPGFGTLRSRYSCTVRSNVSRLWRGKNSNKYLEDRPARIELIDRCDMSFTGQKFRERARRLSNLNCDRFRESTSHSTITSQPTVSLVVPVWLSKFGPAGKKEHPVSRQLNQTLRINLRSLSSKRRNLLDKHVF